MDDDDQLLDQHCIILSHDINNDTFLEDTENNELICNVPYQYQNDRKGSSWYGSVFLVVNAALGAGLLNFPEAFDQAGGILVGSVILVILVVFALFSLIILAHCSEFKCSATYQDVVQTVCGKQAQIFCSVLIVLYCYGTCITFLIIIGDQCDRVFASLHGTDFCHHWYMDRRVTITAISLLFILPLSFSKRIDFLKYASSLGVLAIVYVVMVIVIEYYRGEYIAGPIKTRPDTWTDIFIVVPVICFGYQCHVSVVPIYSCLEPRKIRLFSRTIVIAIAICSVAYLASAIYGYLTFGSLVHSDILESYNANDWWIVIAIFALAVKSVTTYPILQFCGRQAVDNLLFGNVSVSPEKEVKRRVTISSIWFATSLALAIFIPNISVIIDMLGSLAAVFIFLFPGLCLLQMTLRKDPCLLLKKDKLIVLISFIFVSIGVFLFAEVLTQTIRRMAHGTISDAPLCK